MENVKETKNLTPKSKELIKRWVITLLPVVVVVFLLVFYIILLNANGFNITIKMRALLNDFLVLGFVATGAIFIFTLGQFDISLGANTLFSATIGILAYNATGSVFVLFIVCIAVAVVCSVLNSVLAAVFHLPMFVTTVAMLSVLSSIAGTIILKKGTPSGSSFSIAVPAALRSALNALDQNIAFKIALLALFFLICLFVFEFTKTGRKKKFLGGNPVCAKMTGISVSIFGIIAFAMAGLGVGLGAAMTVVYTPTVNSATAGSIGMSVFIAIVFGGMPISGGARSRIYAALIGGISYRLLNQILFILFQDLAGVRDGYVQLISAVLFLAVVFVTGMNYRTKNLPR